MSPGEMVSPITGTPVTLASMNVDEDAGALFADAFGEFLTDTSPVATANAREPLEPTPVAGPVAASVVAPAVTLAEAGQ